MGVSVLDRPGACACLCLCCHSIYSRRRRGAMVHLFRYKFGAPAETQKERAQRTGFILFFIYALSAFFPSAVLLALCFFPREGCYHIPPPCQLFRVSLILSDSRYDRYPHPPRFCLCATENPPIYRGGVERTTRIGCQKSFRGYQMSHRDDRVRSS